MRSAVEEILAYNRSFPPARLKGKLEKLTASPFGFFRGAFPLFAHDIRDGPFRRWTLLDLHGPIVGDLHTENFGAFRCITGDIVYDINDFDETTGGAYEFDLRRLSASLVLSAIDLKHSLGDGVNAVEKMARAYIHALARAARLRKRKEFEHFADTAEIRGLLYSAEEKSRTEFLKKLAHEVEPGRFAFRAGLDDYMPVSERRRKQVMAALPGFLETCVAPENAQPARYTFQDVAFRYAGCGSLGRSRYALLLGKGKKERETWSTLRLVEWKQALDSALESSKPHASKTRAVDVIRATVAFQLCPKRYLGYTRMERLPLQAREIGANDSRFSHRDFARLDRFGAAAAAFGELTARVHLLGAGRHVGPRLLPNLIAAREDRWVNRLLAFAAAYAERATSDYEDLLARSEEVAVAWSAGGRASTRNS